MLNQDVHFSDLVRRELHDMAQPMSSLLCRLELGLILGDEESLREAARGGLDDLQRLTQALSRARQVLAALKAGEAA